MSSPRAFRSLDGELLREQRELAFQTVSLGWWSYDLQSGIVYWDERVREMFGVDTEEQSYETVLAHIHEEDRDYVADNVAKALNPDDPRPYMVEYRLRRADGSIRWIASRGKAWFEGEGPDRHAVAFAGTAVDITETKLAQIALRDSEERFRFLSELGERTRMSLDPEEVMTTIVTMLGSHLHASCCAYADVEDDGDTFRIRKDYTDGFVSLKGIYKLSDFGPEICGKLLSGKTLILRDASVDLPPGAGREAMLGLSVYATVCRPLVKAGKLIAMMAVHQNAPRDWTPREILLLDAVIERAWATIERARVTRELMRSEANFRELADAMPQMIFVAEPDGHVSYFNRKWYEFTGIEEGLVGFENWRDIHDPAHLPHVVERWSEAVREGKLYEIEYRLRRADGEWRWHLGRALPVRDSTGNIVKWFGTNTDIHDKKLLEQQNQRLLESERIARLEAERQSRMKDDFLATLSHELRTPLNAIVGWSEILRRSKTPEDIEKGVEVIHRNAQIQAQIIEDLLDLSRIVSGRIHLDRRAVDPARILGDAMETVRSSADAKNVRLEARIASGGHPIEADASRLQQVFWNLLNNAIKFTPAGGFVRVELDWTADSAVFQIQDSGIGIQPDFLPLIFNRFQQADSKPTRRFGGLGIGLAIVKQIVELHGGSVEARSEGENRGTTFTVRLPLPQQPERQNSPDSARSPGAASGSDAVSLAGLRVLVVDDQDDSRDFVCKLLTAAGADVSSAPGARIAFDRMKTARPDVLVSDIAMPEIDGYTFLRTLRSLHPSEGGTTPALALTAYARPEDQSTALEAGFQEHLAKPVDTGRLLQLVARLGGRLS